MSSVPGSRSHDDGQHGAERRVLIVDDEPAIANTLRMILAQEGFEATSVYSAEDAVQTARLWRPDLLLSDVYMPVLNGIEAAKLIHDEIPECKVILLSANAAVFDLLIEARERGYDFDLLVKPIHPADLLRHIRERLGHRR